MTLEDDWKLVSEAYKAIVKKTSRFGLKTLYVKPKEMRKEAGRKVDFALRRLLDSEKYRYKVHVHGAPTGHFGRNPFKRNGKVWSLISVEVDET